jgi:anti-anti-sigma factor
VAFRGPPQYLAKGEYDLSTPETALLGGLPASFSLQYYDFSGVRVIEVRGEIDLVTSKGLFTTLSTVADRNPEPILLDFSGVHYIDAQGVHALEALAVYLQPHQRRVAMVASSYPVHRIFDLLGVGKTIPWFEAREAAVNFLLSPGS